VEIDGLRDAIGQVDYLPSGIFQAYYDQDIMINKNKSDIKHFANVTDPQNLTITVTLKHELHGSASGTYEANVTSAINGLVGLEFYKFQKPDTVPATRTRVPPSKVSQAYANSSLFFSEWALSSTFGGQRYGFTTQSADGQYFKAQTTTSGLITSYRLQPSSKQKLVGNAFADTLEVYEGADPDHENDRLLRFNIRNASTDDLELLGFRVTLDKRYYKTIQGLVAEADAEYQTALT